MTRKMIWYLPIILGFTVGIWLACQPAQASPAVQEGDNPADILDVEQAVRQELDNVAARETIFLLGSVTITDTRLSKDGSWAISYLILQHPDTGEVLPTEPGLVIARKTDGRWFATLPEHTNWLNMVKAVPEDVLNAAAKEYWLTINSVQSVDVPDAALTGYLLPWEGGKVVSLSGSVSHDQWIPSGNAHYAFDFYISGTMFPVVAAKSGTVHMIRESVQNYDDSDEGNYIVLRDTETNTYQLYLHLAQNSVPDYIQVGDYVHQGDIIGIADDTGASTGHHLHFMVHQTSLSYWGTSVDIVFGDVAINGGRPRVKNYWYDDEPYCDWTGDVCDAFQTSYVSKNYNNQTFPTAKLTAPADWSVVKTSTLTITGSASDSDVGLKSAQLMALYDNYWHNIGPLFTASPFSYAFDLCKAGVADGPLSIGLRIVDNAGNITPMADLVHIQKDYACPVTALPVLGCIPGANEISVYASAGWQGVCVKYPVGVYSGTGLGVLGDNNAASLQVGANVQVTLYANTDMKGRAEAFWEEDGNLDDNLIGADKTSAVKVALRSIPSAPILSWPTSGQTLSQFASLSLYWENPGGALEYQAILKSLSSGAEITSEWHSDPFWHLGTGTDGLNLVTGSYEWRVRARNGAGTGVWSDPRTFIINATSLVVPATKILDFSDSFESTTNGWVGTGLWTRTSTRPARSGIYTWWWGESASGDEHYFTYKHGDLTSPPIQIGATQTAYLRFAYRYQTETTRRFWDQRWVQVSVDHGVFQNLYQLQEDPMNAEESNPDWMLSPYLNLSAYAGHTVRIRFHFDTMDPSGAVLDNDFDGWSIDDVNITISGPAACNYADAEQGALLSSNAGAIPAEICPPGNIDQFSFAALAGEQFVADVDAFSIGSPLDGYLFILDSDGASAVAENDDQRSGYFDPLLRFTAPRDGLYSVKLRAWDHGRTGGPEALYTLSLYKGDYVEPVVQLITPQDFTWVVGNPVPLAAQILETGSGVDRVEFYWHSQDWLSGLWQKLPDPVQVGDSWVTTFDPGLKGTYQAAFYAIAYDNMGLVGTDIAWNVSMTVYPPRFAFLPMILR